MTKENIKNVASVKCDVCGRSVKDMYGSIRITIWRSICEDCKKKEDIENSKEPQEK